MNNTKPYPIAAVRALAATLVLSASAWTPFIPAAHAQIATTISHTLHDESFSNGRDFWFAEMSYDWGIDSMSGASMRVYITSPNNTEAYIAYGTTRDSLSISAYSVGTYLLPQRMQLQSSGIVENKAFHVWSNDADLIVTTMNAVPNSTDGCTIIPAIGCGKDYVVAAYQSLYYEDANGLDDFPSECAIVANQDSTHITIIPSCDCRECTSGTETGNADTDRIAFHAGVSAQIVLNRGQVMQLLPTKITGPIGFDVTGTVIHADRPIGVFGGCSQTNIPDTFHYFDHVEEMIPPLRTWGKTYMGTSFHQPQGAPPGHDKALYLLISSKPNQVIMRHTCLNGTDTEAVIPTQYAPVWEEEEIGNKFFSDAPFLCMEYRNSASYPDGVNGNGDPAEGFLVPREQFLNTVVTQTPTAGGVYYNYANITVNVHDDEKTHFDGAPVNVNPGQCLDGEWEIFTINNISAGVHPISGGDSGTSVYVYGYGYDESYAYGTAEFEGNANTADTIAPFVDTSGTCFERRIHIRDSGMLPDRITPQSGIAMVRLDSIYNMTYVADSDLIEGTDVDTTGYSLSVIDQTKVGIVRVTIFDAAGNSTTVTSRYTPYLTTIEPPLMPVGIQHDTTPVSIAYDTIYNRGSVPFPLANLHLLNGNLGFSLHDSIGGPPDLSPLPSGHRRLIQIQFKSIEPTIVFDTIEFGNACVTEEAAIAGSGGANDFLVSDAQWPLELVPAPQGGYVKEVTLWNFSPGPISIDSVWWNDTVHFKRVTPLPITLPPGPSKVPCSIAFFSDSILLLATEGHWSSPSVLNGNVRSWRTDSLTGRSGLPKTVFTSDTTIIDSCVSKGDFMVGELTLSAVGNAPSTIERVTESDQVDFGPLMAVVNGESVDPANPMTIPAGESATISVNFIQTSSLSDTLVDVIYAFDPSGNLIGGKPCFVTFHIQNPQYLAPKTLSFDTISFPSPLVFKTYPVTNDGNSPVTMNAVMLDPSEYNSAFQITTNPPLPYAIPPGDSLLVTVTYNDSLFGDSVQSATIEYSGNSCTTIPTTIAVERLTASVAEPPEVSLAKVVLSGASLVVSLENMKFGTRF
ncbi:MAG TPA: IgGFc-binding protein, partial [Candidatus Kapabacteria bacterium]